MELTLVPSAAEIDDAAFLNRSGQIRKLAAIGRPDRQPAAGAILRDPESAPALEIFDPQIRASGAGIDALYTSRRPSGDSRGQLIDARSSHSLRWPPSRSIVASRWPYGIGAET